MGVTAIYDPTTKVHWCLAAEEYREISLHGSGDKIVYFILLSDVVRVVPPYGGVVR
jgi:hypothetical protein